MFKCNKCHKITQPGEMMTKKVVKTRSKTYKYEIPKKEPKYTEGWEIVSEVCLCKDCANETK